MARTTITLFVILIFIICVFVLQFFLSKRENRWPGLVLPIMCFLFSLLYPLNLVVPSEGTTFSEVAMIFIVWLIGNIPTIIMLAIYFSCREKFKRAHQVNKMNIQDLD